MIVSQSKAGFNGEFYEEMAARFLELGLGMRVLGRRIRGRGYELDLVVECEDGVVVVEVKGSSRVDSDLDLERVTHEKIRRIRRGFLEVKRRFGVWPCGLMVVGVSKRLASAGQIEISWAVVEGPTTDF